MKVDRSFIRDNGVVVSVSYSFEIDGEDAQILAKISSTEENMLVHQMSRIIFSKIANIKEDAK